MKTEVKVGVFILLGLASLLFLTFQIKTLENLKEKGYVLYAFIGDASGLNNKSRVKLRGVKIGVVDSMKLETKRVKLKLLIRKDVKIPIGSKVTIAQDNVLGGKYLKIIPSNSDEYYKEQDTIKSFVEIASMESVLNNLNTAIKEAKVLIQKLNTTLDDKAINNIQTTISNVKIASEKLNSILNTTNQKLPVLLDNSNRLVLTYKKSGEILNKKLPLILNKVDNLASNTNELVTVLKVKISKLADEYIKVGKNVNNVLKDNNETLKQTIVSAEEFFQSGSNSFKKIDDFLGSVNNSQIVVDISNSYMFKDSSFLTTANIAYLPNPTKYYIFGLTSRKNYSVPNPVDKSKIFINAEIGKRYENVLLRGGIIESTGGVGIDYFTMKDKLKFSSEIYDFNSENDIRGNNPHLNFKTTYLYLKHIEFMAGVDNVLNDKARTFFLGLGIKFKDNDLKPLISGGATSFLK